MSDRLTDIERRLSRIEAFLVLEPLPELVKSKFPERDRNMPLPSPQEVADAASAAGGWSRKTLAKWGIAWPPLKGWRRALEDEWIAQQDNK